MAKTNPKPEYREELATLALAKAIVEDDASGVRLAIEAGANTNAVWIDGRTRLRDLPTHPGFKLSDAVKKSLTSRGLKRLLSQKEDSDLWSDDFVQFVVMRGYNFAGITKPPSGKPSCIKGLINAATALWRIADNYHWVGLKNAYCSDASGSKSIWTFDFLPRWNGVRRISPYQISFTVDALSWDLVERFEKMKADGEDVEEWPEFNDPLIASQKDWEGNALFERHFLGKPERDIKALVTCMRKGGNPFARFNGKYIEEHYQNPETVAFMEVIREAIGGENGWYLHMKPLLTRKSLRALKEKAILKVGTAPSGGQPIETKDGPRQFRM
ncbi:hypothetical protein NHH82_12380 [Oxalobacteraceae bacterium OTU3REALA1]|nr:hypothetical protein NHH82_12380 [Oxalobacteraceae bacterium OTU3REALA1]